MGLAFMSEETWVPNKLTLISTWDGDEVSLTRLAWTLRATRRLPIAERADQLAQILSSIGEVSGEGLYRVVECDDAEDWQRDLLKAGFRVDSAGAQALRFAPALNVSAETLDRLEAAVEAAAGGRA